MGESLGTRLRQHRERRQVPLAAIAEQTKIKVSLLAGLERDDLSRWPEGIFRRAYVRDYAHAIGLPPDEILREFLQAHPDPAEAPGTPAEPAPPSGQHVLGRAVSLLARLGSGLRQHDDVGADPPPQEALRQEVAGLSCHHLSAVAALCTRIARAESLASTEPLLREAVRLLDAVGAVIWVWDPAEAVLRVGLAHGYPDQVLARLPCVRPDAGDAVAAAFRSRQLCTVNVSAHATGAVAVPMPTPGGCVGVLAVELRQLGETDSTRAVATILAAQFAGVVDADRRESRGSRRAADLRPAPAVSVLDQNFSSW